MPPPHTTPPATAPNVAIVGATGAVGREMLAILHQRRFTHGTLKLLASSRSAGTVIECCGRHYVIEELTEDSFRGVDLALFSAGGAVSRRYAPLAVKAGATVVDNSSAFRRDDDVPLVVPELNGEALNDFSGGVIANPNCTTMIVLMAVTPLHRAVGVKRMVVSTYQAVSGAGAAWMNELEQQARDFAAGRPYTTDVTGRQCLFNVFSHNSPIGPDGYNEEETKLRRETRKIWNDQSVKITATCVRVPVLRAHCASINLTIAKPTSGEEAKRILEQAPGVRVVDDRQANRFPEPIDATGVDDVLVGRIREDTSQPPGMGLELFVAGDQLRKGAALNAIQIADLLL
ncbi:MAG: aspartate-semialdehyde dehydrogenase [Phycisphaerales bacterium]|nr:MAG: aspartate-semialdehyde dehydrogenase [Phycisphaerales bacterium]